VEKEPSKASKKLESLLGKRASSEKKELSSKNTEQKGPSNKAKFSIPRLKQLKYISQFLNSREKLLVKIFLTALIISLIFLGIRVYSVHLKSYPRSGGSYAEAIVGNPQFINPVLGVTSDIDKDLTFLIYSGLLKYNKNQELIPDLASNYTISEDQKIYTFYLKKDVVWHDDEQLTADDIIYTIKTIQNPDYKSPLFVSFKGVDVHKIDNHTIEFQLEEPFAPFLSILTVGIIPAHLWEPLPPEQFSLAVYNTKAVGSGPYKYKSLSKDKTGFIRTYNLEVNNDFYRRPPYIKNFTFKFYSDFTEATEALLGKNVDGLSYVPKELKEKIEEEKKLLVSPLRLPQYTAVFFNQTNNDYLKSKDIRKALAYALDKEKIVTEALNRSGEIIHSPILPGSIGYNPDIHPYNLNLEEAEKLIKNTGFVKITTEEYLELKGLTSTSTEIGSQEFFLQKGRDALEVDLTTVSQSENEKTAHIVKESWQKIGIKVNLKIVSSSKIKDIIKTRNYEALLYGIITGFDPDPYPFWHSSQNQDPGLNLAVFSNREVDHVLEDARKSNDEQIRKDKYTHFQNIINEEAPAIFLYSPTYTYVLPTKIKGFEATRIAQPSDRFINIENWYIKTRKALK